jgi:hypothetical protein
MSTQLHILGIRHHGPGSARSVRLALDELKPDVVLIEGPPDADAMIPFADRMEMVPPVAILVHDVERPAAAVYYPFAVFSPEWQAMRWASWTCRSTTEWRWRRSGGRRLRRRWRRTSRRGKRRSCRRSRR